MSTDSRPYFVTLEGTEGMGKTTQIAYLKDFLEKRGITCCVTREPGGTPLGEKLRTLLLQEVMHPDAELLLMFAARAQHWHTVIQPALQRGEWVICDRFTDSSYAYQGGGREMGCERIAQLEAWVLGAQRPDITLWFDAPFEIGLQRAAARRGVQLDKFEQENQAFHARVRAMYEQLAIQFPHRYRRIDATQSIPAIQMQLDELFQPIL